MDMRNTLVVEVSHKRGRGYQYRYRHRDLVYRSFNLQLLVKMAGGMGYTHYRLPDGRRTKIQKARGVCG